MVNRIDLSRADLNLLTLFEVVLEERHVGRAAARLHLTPSAVSHGLARLRRLLHDPLFIRHPKGLNPTERALMLAAPVADILGRARAIIGAAEAFDPLRSERRFVIGAVDAIGSVVLPALVARIREAAPGISVGVRAMFPGDMAAMLDSRVVDLALVPLISVPARFHAHELYVDDFVAAARKGHPFLAEPSLQAYCEAAHLLVAQESDRGFIDDLLAAQGLTRQVSLTVPSFMWGLAVLAETDLIAAMPRRLVERHGARSGVAFAELPVPVQAGGIGAVTAKAAMADPGIAWLIECMAASVARSADSDGSRYAPARRSARPAR